MRLSTVALPLGLLACHALAYTQNASIAISEAPYTSATYLREGVVQVPIVNTSIVPVTCTELPFAVKNATLLPIVTPDNSSYTCAFLAQPCGFDLGEVSPEHPSATFESATRAAQCWWPFNPDTGLSYPI
ncbi:uncharacterized protein BO80DRAFT_425607 [Aspergillus ibericus CBS 121593]|uniref:Ubiquitin 3 binding protein But2 C-terminal domain-containing protein n=1 Tax=Aspergillus ibericus CBS 121593 TaxID=1448316 RepID=A0A395GXU9_9EURO|nr:hypothetical protein BO80DRAFT_425607 [Aspergillus ibericus CBS 121593]RAL00442.1 hypothetical protein BO80DRAFT_425607 [Aspergillus ibericus CBS 121593]